MTALEGTPLVLLKLDDEPVGERLLRCLDRVDVEVAWNRPALAILRFVDPPSQTAARDPFPLGAPLEIQVRSDRGAPRSLGTFDVTAARWRYSAAGELVLEVEAADALERMARRQTGLGLRRRNLRDALHKLCAAVDLRGPKGDVPRIKMPSLLQARGTDLELLERLCRTAGRRFLLRGDALHLAEPGAGDGKPRRLTWGGNLLELEASTSLADQVAAVQARSWDPDQQKARLEQVTEPQRDDARYAGLSGPQWGSKAAATEPLKIHPRPLPDRADARRAAQAEMDRRAETFLHLEGTCDGDVDLQPGARIELTGVARLHAGVRTVDRVLHRIDSAEGFLTKFEVGAAPTEQPPAPAERGMTCVPARVIDTDDPDEQGRVRVSFEPLGDGLESDWLRVVHPGAGRFRGQFLPPHEGDEVLVLLESDSLDAGYVLGGLYSTVNPPADEFEQAHPHATQGFWSAAGHRVVMNDDDDTIEIRLAKDSRIRMANKHALIHSGGSLELSDAFGSRLTMQRHKVELLCNTKFHVITGHHEIRLHGGHINVWGRRVDFRERGPAETEDYEPPPPTDDPDAPDAADPDEAPPPAEIPIPIDVPEELEPWLGVIDNIQFKYNSADLVPPSFSILGEAAKAMNKWPDFNFEVQGHASTEGEAAYNLTLSQARAASVCAWLSQHGGVAEARLTPVGYGESRPVLGDDGREDREASRRVEFHLVAGRAQPTPEPTPPTPPGPGG